MAAPRRSPAPTGGMMLERGILKAVLPEVEPKRLSDVEALILAERRARIGADSLRRFAALLPRDPTLAEDIAARLRLSNKARKRLACAARNDLLPTPPALASRFGPQCAIDRLLLAGQAHEATAAARRGASRPATAAGAARTTGAAAA